MLGFRWPRSTALQIHEEKVGFRAFLQGFD
jgi:hypothetical protein